MFRKRNIGASGKAFSKVARAIGPQRRCIAEPLERRTLLNGTVTLSTTNDVVDGNTGSIALLMANPGADGKIGLREALAAADNTSSTSASPNTINVPAGTYNLSHGQISFGNSPNLNTVINGQGTPASTTIHQTDGVNRIMEMDTAFGGNVLVTIQNITLSGGHPANASAPDAVYGGGAIADGDPGDKITLINDVFSGNSTDTTDNGGAISWSGGGDLTVQDTVFTNNTASSAIGGAIAYNNGTNAGTLDLERCTFSGNQATAGAGAGQGGAVWVSMPAANTTTITRCTFLSNSVGTPVGQGGAIYTSGGTITISFCRFAGNTAATGSGLFKAAGTGTVSADDNWWGTNSGPGTAASGPTITRWLQLRNIPNPTMVNIGQVSALTSDLFGRNSGGPISASNLVGLASFPVPAANVFSNAIKGSLSSISTQFINGIATANITTASPGGMTHADATADNQVVTASISVPPVPPSVPDLEATSDSGSLSTDNLTNVASPVYDVTTADASATVQLLRDGTVVASRSGPGALTDSNPPEGVHAYTAVQVIDTVPSPASTGLSVTIDRTPPIAPNAPDLQAGSDSGSLSTDNITKITNPTFDLSGTIEGGASIQLLRAGVVKATRTGAGAAQDPGPVTPDGAYAYTARQVDLAGNVSVDSGTLTVTIDTTALPPSPPDLQTASDSGTSGTDNITNVASPTFDLSGAETGAAVQLLRGGVSVATRTGNGAATDPGPLSDNTYSYTAVQTDLAGNVSTASTVLSVTIDRTAPQLTGTPVFQFSVGPQSVSYSFNENVGPSLVSHDFLVQNLTAATTLADGSKSVSGTTAVTLSFSPQLIDGNYRVTVAASDVTDVAGNALSAGSVFDFFIYNGDTDHNRTVDVSDLGNLASNYGITTGGTWIKGDSNYDGKVDVTDLGNLSSNYGKTLAPPPAPPGRMAVEATAAVVLTRPPTSTLAQPFAQATTVKEIGVSSAAPVAPGISELLDATDSRRGKRRG